MGIAKEHPPVLLFLAAFSRHEAGLQWACAEGCRNWGPIVLASERLPFESTDYYQPQMGSGLMKQLLAFENLIDPSELAARKHQANAWEARFQQQSGFPEPRPLNVDPGYLTEAKVVLATTKDRDHRLYLGQGIFGEVTLYYQRGRGWQPHAWTYPDYRTPAYHRFFTRCRTYLRERNHES